MEKRWQKNADSCPNCGAKNKKTIFTKVWFWIVLILIVPIIYVNVTSPIKEYSATIIETNEIVRGYDLIQLSNDNPYSYDSLYNGETVKVVATIADIWKKGTFNGRPHGPVLQLGGGWLVEISPNNPLLPILKDGDKVEIVGTMHDVYNDYIWTTNATVTKSN